MICSLMPALRLNAAVIVLISTAGLLFLFAPHANYLKATPDALRLAANS